MATAAYSPDFRFGSQLVSESNTSPTRNDAFPTLEEELLSVMNSLAVGGAFDPFLGGDESPIGSNKNGSLHANNCIQMRRISNSPFGDDSGLLMDNLMPRANAMINNIIDTGSIEEDSSILIEIDDNVLNKASRTSPLNGHYPDTIQMEVKRTSVSSGGSVCPSCDEGNEVSSTCLDCRELLCNNCVKAHRRVKLTKDHCITGIDGSNPSSRKTSPVLPISSTPISCAGPKLNFCDTHENHQLILYCETCSLAICNDCAVTDHREHNMVYIQDAFDNSKKKAKKFLSEAKTSLNIVDDTMATLRKLLDGLDRTAQKTFLDIRSQMNAAKLIFEAREESLNREVENAHKEKSTVLRSQVNELTNYRMKIIEKIDETKNALERDNCVEIIKIKDKIVDCIKKLKDLRDLQPNDNGEMEFSSTNDLFDMIRVFGSVKTGSYGPYCTACGDGLKRSIIGRISNFEVYSRDYFKRSGGVGGEPVQVVIQAKSGNRYNGRVADRRDGTYYVSYKTSFEGEHLVHVTLRGLNIHGSPFVIISQKTRIYSQISYNHFASFASDGVGPGQLCRPWGVCCDREGRIVVADRSNNRIQIFSPEGQYLHKFGCAGNQNGQFDRPAGVAVDNQNRIIVADKDNHRIQIFTFDGIFLHKFGEKGSKIGCFNYPWDVAVSSVGNIAVSDTRNHRIQLFDCNGHFITKFGLESQSWKQFDSPRGLAFDCDDSLVCTDFNNHRIVRLLPDLTKPRYMCDEGTSNGKFERPQGIVVDPDGNLIVADSKNHRIQVLDGKGNFLYKFGCMGKGQGHLDRPSGICMSPGGKIIVVDFGNNRVVVF